MSHEQEPKPEYESMFLHLGEVKLTFSKRHGFGFTHKEPKHDHIWVVLQGTPDAPEQSLYLFRELFEHHGVDMDEFLDYMKEMEFYVQSQEKASESDLDMYKYWISDGKTDQPLLVVKPDESEAPAEPSKELVHVPTPEADELTVYGGTMERRIELNAEFIAYLIETGRAELL